MKRLIAIVCILLSFQLLAQTPPLESPWKTKGRHLVTKILGDRWGVKFFGPLPVVTSVITLPEIPTVVKKNTDVSSYTKIQKEPTEFDQLPKERKRQFDYKFLQELFQVTRKTAPKDEDLSNWLNTLDQGGSREGIYQALVLDEVYSALENMDEKPSKKLLDFTLNFSRKFLNQTFTEDSISQLNSYSLKRIVSEKLLDLMEYFETKNLDALYRWYAILSSDLATNFSHVMVGQVRHESSPEFHYEWAKSMPIQHIKSEVIIKIHSTMNGLQVL